MFNDNQLPTPLANILNRLSVEADGRGRFDTALLAFEAHLKYCVNLLLAGLRTLDPDGTYEFEYRLTRSESLGEWANVLGELLKALNNFQIPEWLFDLKRWMESRIDKVNADAGKIKRSCETLSSRLSSEGDEYDGVLKSPQHVFNFLVFVRNKTRGHGAKNEAFYLDQGAHLEDIVACLIRSCPISEVTLGFLIPARFNECIWLRGPLPNTRSTVPQGLVQHEGSELFVFPSDGSMPIFLPPLISYDMAESRCLFANGGYSLGTQKLEFIDYFSGRTKKYLLPHYASEPVPKAYRVRNIGAFPLDSQIFGRQFCQCHDHALLTKAANTLPKARWHSFELLENNIARIPSEPGIYCLVSQPNVAGIDHIIVGYTGQASSLRQRFQDYLRERRDDTSGRDLVKVFLKNFPKLHFNYTIVDKGDDRSNLEDWLVKALDPPANTHLRIRRGSATHETDTGG